MNEFEIGNIIVNDELDIGEIVPNEDLSIGELELDYEGQVQVDWEQEDNTKKDYIKNKPTIPTTLDDIEETEDKMYVPTLPIETPTTKFLNGNKEWVNVASGSSVLVLDSISELPETATDGDMAYVKSSIIPHTPTIFELDKLYSQIYINPIPEKQDLTIKTDKFWLQYSAELIGCDWTNSGDTVIVSDVEPTEIDGQYWFDYINEIVYFGENGSWVSTDIPYFHNDPESGYGEGDKYFDGYVMRVVEDFGFVIQPEGFMLGIGTITEDILEDSDSIYFYVWEAFEDWGITEAGWYFIDDEGDEGFVAIETPIFDNTTLTLSEEEFIIIENYLNSYISDNSFDGTEILGDRLYIYQNGKWTLVNEEVAKTYSDLSTGITGRHAHVMENSTTSSWNTLTETILDNLPDVFEMKFAETPTFIHGADYFTYISFENGATLQFNPSDLPEPTFIYENSNYGHLYIYTATEFELDFGTGTLLHFVVGWNVVENLGEEDMSVNPIEYSNIPIISDTGISDIYGYPEYLFPSILVNSVITNYKGDYIFNGKKWQYEPYNVVKTNEASNKALFGDGTYKLIPELVTYIGWGNTDEQVPSALSVFNSLQAKEDPSNKITDLFSYSDDTHYPSTNAVKNYLSGQLGNYIESSTVINGYVPYSGAVYDVDLGNHSFNIGTNHLFNVDITNDCVAINGSTDTTHKLIIGGKTKFGGTLNLNNQNVNNGIDYAQSVVIGSNACYGITQANLTGALVIGGTAGYGASGSDYSTFIGLSSGYSATNNTYGIFIGESSGIYSTGGLYMLNIGSYSGNSTHNCQYGVNLGYQAGSGSDSCIESINLGYYAGQLSRGSHNIFIGSNAGKEMVGAGKNIVIGHSAGWHAYYATDSIFIGQDAGMAATNSHNCIFIGREAGDDVNNSAYGGSIVLGRYGKTSGYTDSIVIGNWVENTANNQLNIANVIQASGIWSTQSVRGTLVSTSKVTMAKINLAHCPTSASGLARGDVYRDDDGFLKIV